MFWDRGVWQEPKLAIRLAVGDWNAETGARGLCLRFLN